MSEFTREKIQDFIRDAECVAKSILVQRNGWTLPADVVCHVKAMASEITNLERAKTNLHIALNSALLYRRAFANYIAQECNWTDYQAFTEVDRVTQAMRDSQPHSGIPIVKGLAEESERLRAENDELRRDNERLKELAAREIAEQDAIRELFP